MSNSSPYDQQACKSLESWTDGLPICKQCGVGQQTNQWYKEGGGRLDTHGSEDRFVHRKCQQSLCSLYGVFDGHDGAHVADFAAQRLPAELLLGQLEVDLSDDSIRLALLKAFESVENGYKDSIDETLVQKFNLQAQLPEGMGSYEAVKRYPNLVHRLNSIEREISGGATATVLLIHDNKCYVANVGDVRALLCRIKPTGELLVQQLSVDHTLNNKEESQRLELSDWDKATISENMLGSMTTTRSLGDSVIKSTFQEMDSSRKGTNDPIIAVPSIWGGEMVDDSYYFIAIVSSGLYKAIEEITETKDVNVDIVNMVVNELPNQSTIQGVAQAVVDKVCRMHQDAFAQTDGKRCKRRDDMTLLLRLFHAQLGGNAASPTSPLFHPVSIPFTGNPTKPSLSLIMPFNQQKSNSNNTSPSVVTPDSANSQATPPTAHTYSTATVNSLATEPRLSPSTSQPIAVTNYQDNTDKVIDMKPLNVVVDDIQKSSDQLLIERQQKMIQHQSASSGSGDGSKFGMKWNPSVSESEAESSLEEDRTQFLNKGPPPMEIGPDKKVAAYVDFTDFINRLEADGGESVVFQEFMREPHI